MYGTLKPAHRNAAWAFAAAAPLRAEPATLHGFALHHLGAYPGIVAGAGEVRGVLLAYPTAAMPRVLAKMDELEDCFGPAHPENLYHRKVREIRLQAGETVRAWVYVYARAVPNGSLIAGGEWLLAHEAATATVIATF